MLGHIKPYIEKIHYTDTELARRAHKLDVKLKRLCGGVAFLCLLRAFLPSFANQALALRSEVTNNTFLKQRLGALFTLKLECHNSYKSLLLCDSANGDIA